MKIRCTECKKRFDYELYSGVCPECGTYIRSEEEMEEDFGSPSGYKSDYPMESREAPSSPVPAQSSGEFKKTKETGKSKEVRKKQAARIYTVVITFLIAAVGAGTYAGFSLVKNNREEERRLDSLQEPRTVGQGDVFSYETENNRYDITIDSVTVDEDPALNVPYGYEMLVVSYHIERIYTGSGAGDFDSFYDIAMNPYAETKSGTFLEPVRTYDLESAKAKDGVTDLQEIGISIGFSLQEGKMYYLVKEDDFKGLYITSVDYDTYKYDYGALREVIRVEGLEVQR